jgi:hypothetical protein
MNTLKRLTRILGLFALVLQAQAQTQTQNNPDATPWNQRSWEDRAFKSTYEDKYSFKHRLPFDLDPYIWAYSPEFAERFRMPKQWIDPGLKGALAVAWRMTTIGTVGCGLGGREDSCWPPLTCQMDIYFDGKAPLPWRYNDVMRDNFMRGISSKDFLPWLSPQSKTFGGPGSRSEPVLNGALKYVGKRDVTPFGRILYFDREYEPNVAMIGFGRACPSKTVDAAAYVGFFSQEEQDRTRGFIQNYAHIAEFSAEYMRRITAAYIEQDKPNSEVAKRLYEDYLKRRQAVPLSNAR